MTVNGMSPDDRTRWSELISHAIQEAEAGKAEGGIPIGAVLVDQKGRVVARGRNRRIQNGDPTAHAETECFRNAGRRRDWQELTLVSTLSPCAMCTGTTVLFKVPRVIIGENQTFLGAEHWFQEHGIEAIVLADQRCIELMTSFTSKYPDLWNEDRGL